MDKKKCCLGILILRIQMMKHYVYDYIYMYNYTWVDIDISPHPNRMIILDLCKKFKNKKCHSDK